MHAENKAFSTGIPALDDMLQDVHPGDNIVFQADNSRDVLPFIHRFCQYAQHTGKPLVYFRFADHPSFLPEGFEAVCYQLHPQESFEQFISEILETIKQHGKGMYYLFDCLSGLAVNWYTDRMLANFFRLVCPYLFTFDTLSYFVLLRNSHRTLAINAIHDTAQVVLDIFCRNERIYILPVKVLERHSPTMYMLHFWNDEAFLPVTKSATLSEILSGITQPSIDFDTEYKDTWTSTFFQALQIVNGLREIGSSVEDIAEFKTHLIKMIITRDERLLALCAQYFDIPDLVAIGKRLIGTGLIGGKSVGMLLARNILKKKAERLHQRLEPHDSFFIGSDVFYSYIVHNNCWWERHNLKTSADLLEHAGKLREKLLAGEFPPDILQQFQEMLNYFGQSPIVVRSSSLLEDAYGNSFSGKYESIFCANQGTPEQRMQNFIEVVRRIYASTMNQEALAYRVHRGLLNQDEQMALLVQRVSGEFYDSLYFPQIAGVGYSFNPFVWHPKIKPGQGMLRLVFGLGTRAVERRDDDYTRVVALNQPLLRPEGSSDEIRKYSQKIVNVINLAKNQHTSCTFEEIVKAAPGIPLEMLATRDFEMEARAKSLNIKNIFSYVLNFEKLLTHTPFVQDMKEMLSVLSHAYDHPVDIEFAVNFLNDEEYRIHLLQCRPLQFIGKFHHVQLPKHLPQDDIILKTDGPIIGQSTAEQIARIIYVIPDKYSRMPPSDRYSVARLIGRLTSQQPRDQHLMLIGPGRWGTQMPELGVPVSFSEIQNASVLCELAQMHEALTPDLSLGTHFFNDIVEMGIVYIGLSSGKDVGFFHDALLQKAANKFPLLLPGYPAYADAILVIDTAELAPDARVLVHVDTLTQKGLVFLSRT
ncbi:pyruvate phosphate dikinase PEP/pyruvate-binding [Candidatus Vecturithrix granuli]|uniref:Phosphoenolpyruvate synthase n=1 Tax=Vecturithrix granuli TaxID=1499967 RepID=A0A081C3V1_VECG1|nr:pyruvate phosphate dikinase PEP/pyruvate-binding [Candidatus Vecturithrix granuli]